MVLGEVKRTFNPEFINRIDEIIVFEALTDDDLRRIMGLLVTQLNENLIDRKLKIALTPEVVDWIIEVTCKDRSYGARPLRRAIQRYVEDPLSEELIRGHLRGGEIEVYLDAGQLAYRPGRRARGGPQARVESDSESDLSIRSDPGPSTAVLKSSRLTDGPQPISLSSVKLPSMFELSQWFWRSVPRWLAAPLAGAQARPPAQPPAPPAALPAVTVCGQRVPRPLAQPPAGSGPVVLFIAPCFEAQGNASVIEPQTYLYYIQLKPSRAVAGHVGARTTTPTEKIDPRRLPAAVDHQLPRQPVRSTSPTTRSRTASIGKLVIYNMEERQRVKIVDYTGSKKVETTKIDEKLKEANAADPPRHVHRSRPGPEGRRHRPRHDEGEGLPVRRGHPRDQGRCRAARSWCTSPSTSTKGPKVKIRKIEFVGNKAISDGTLQQADEGQQARALVRCSFITGRGTYQETKFDEDAEQDRRVLPRPRLHHGQRRRAGAEGRRATRTTRRRAGSSCGFR